MLIDAQGRGRGWEKSYLAGAWGEGLLCEGHRQRAGEAVTMALCWGWAGLGWRPFCPAVSPLRGEELACPEGKGGDEPPQKLSADPKAADWDGGGVKPRVPGLPPCLGPQGLGSLSLSGQRSSLGAEGFQCSKLRSHQACGATLTATQQRGRDCPRSPDGTLRYRDRSEVSKITS